mmetsp:Transcript_10468/g.13710  ORF Transcript_10468/g.13710 Transcript_10468/m.13710 type:complete len:97 (+) Transcript_10468:247-537(+)
MVVKSMHVKIVMGEVSEKFCPHKSKKDQCFECSPHKFCEEHVARLDQCYKCNGRGCKHLQNPKTCYHCRIEKGLDEKGLVLTEPVCKRDTILNEID